MSLCPSCGREVGSHVSCPYCGANLERRLTITLFGVFAILLAAGGLALLCVFSVNASIPRIRIGQIQAAMNYAYVRIEGIVRRPPDYNPDSQSLTFWIEDETGRMLVSAFRSDALALIAAERVPAIGDRVSAAGTLRVREEAPSLTLNSADGLAITRALDAVQAREIDAITPDGAWTAVTVRGQVRTVREPYAGLRVLTVRDATGDIDLVIDSSAEQFGGPPPQAQLGDPIQVTGIVTLFEGRPQITLTRGDRLSVLGEPVEIAEPVSIRGLGDADIGRWVRVQGTIAKIAPFSAGVKFTLTDQQGQDLALLLWQDVFAALPDGADWQIGAEVIAQGQINAFRGELELVPEIPIDVAILSRAAAETQSTALNLTRIGTITHDDVGNTVFISGTIDTVDRFATGVRFRVDDDSGSILLVLFDNVFEQIERAEQLEEGVSVSALGKVSEFNGALEVIPPNGASVRVAAAGLPVATDTPLPAPPTRAPARTPGPGVTATLTVQPAPLTPTVTVQPSPTPSPTAAAPTSTLTSTLTAIGSITVEQIGQVVTVRGRVIETYSFSAGFRFTLSDGTGAIQMVLFDGRYRELADRAALNLSAQVLVTATVASFNDRLELQPSAGSDVIIEQPGSNAIISTRAINTLSSADAGSLVAIVGDVLRVEGFSAGVSVFINDGTGEVRVVIFSNVLNYVPNAPSLQAGARARVVGVVDEFNGALEVVPALGFDVTLNP